MDADLDPHLGPYFLPLRFKLYPLLSRPHPPLPKKPRQNLKIFTFHLLYPGYGSESESTLRSMTGIGSASLQTGHNPLKER